MIPQVLGKAEEQDLTSLYPCKTKH